MNVKLRNIDVFMICCCAIAVGLCYAGRKWAPPVFVLSSSAGLFDTIKHKALVGAIINGMFLALNIALFVKEV